MCVSDMCDGDCACGMCGKHVYTIVHVCERSCCFRMEWLDDVSM